MNLKSNQSKWLLCLVCGLFLLLSVLSCKKEKTSEALPERISEFGKYEGYSEPIYEEWIRTSQYITMRDGVKLAIDIVRPAKNGEAVEKPMPLVWTHTRYQRARLREGKVLSVVDMMPDMQLLIKHGYVVCSVDVRGGGASFGRYEGAFSEAETKDAYEIVEWLASQPWSTGKIGMYGQSYLGITQFMAASQAPPHLTAIFPSMAGFDLFNLVYPGGIYREDFIMNWGTLTRQLDVDIPPPPVDEDSTGEMLKEAVSQHQDNWDVIAEAKKGNTRDSEAYAAIFGKANPSVLIQAINASEVPVYQWNGWYDIYVKGVFQWIANLKNPIKLTVGPWAHGTYDPEKSKERSRLIGIEQLRWFDYWLKGIDNGIMDEPSITYALYWEPNKWTWHTTDTWPLPTVKNVEYFLANGPSGSLDSANDGLLSTESPGTEKGHDAYIPDFTTTSGTQTRWDNSSSYTAMVYPDMTENDKKGLTYTTAPLTKDVTVIGHPVITLYVSSTAEDSDIYVFFEEVDKEGVSHYLSEGWQRASQWALGDPPYDNLGLPFHPILETTKQKLTKDQIVSLEFDLLPVSNVFNTGNRIRITLACADKDNTETIKTDPLPTLKIYRNSKHPSKIILPIVQE